MSYSYPEEHLAWYIMGDRLGLITTKNTSAKNLYESIDESQTNGLLIEYTAQPNEVDNLSDIPDVDDTVHLALVYYINWKLFEDNQDQESLISSMKYKQLWNDNIKNNAGRDKVGGARKIVPFPFTWGSGSGVGRNNE